MAKHSKWKRRRTTENMEKEWGVAMKEERKKKRNRTRKIRETHKQGGGRWRDLDRIIGEGGGITDDDSNRKSRRGDEDEEPIQEKKG